MKTYTAELLADAKAELGEGPTWDDSRGLLFWVDFLGKKLHAWDPASRQDRVVLENRPVSAVAIGAGKSLALACADGLWRFSPEEGLGEKLADPEAGKANMRFNDGKVDPQGFFCVGSMDQTQQAARGTLYRFDASFRETALLHPVMLTNGLGWSPDGKLFYYIDTPTLQVRCWQWDAADGPVGQPRVVYQVPEGEGYPDGLAVDAEGMLWVALYLGSSVLRLHPESGEVLARLEIPGVSRVTCPGFGGKNRETLYVTTAWEHAGDEEKKARPHAGGLFSFTPGVGGLPVRACRAL